MKSSIVRRTALAWALYGMIVASPVMATVDGSEQKSRQAAEKEAVEATLATDANSATEESLKSFDAEVARRMAERRAAMLEEANAALEETTAALDALDEGKTDEALDALARATGKLELIVARDPDLALAPVDVEFITHDLYATPEAIRKAREQVEALFDAGRIQEARTLLSGLVSETIVRVSNLPLASYPKAIKAISPLIDEGKTEEAKRALQAALATVVVTDQVIPLPMLRAEHALAAAQELLDREANVDEAEVASGEAIANAEKHLKTMREQLERARLLGYGEEAEHDRLRTDLAKLEDRLGTGDETDGLFASLRRSIGDLQASLFE